VLTPLPLALGDDKAASSPKEENAPDIAPPTKDDLADKRIVFWKSALAQYTVEDVWGIERRKFVGASCAKYYARAFEATPGETVPD
jgi:hypothetical protein